MGSIRASWASSARLGRVRGVLWVHFGKLEGVWETSRSNFWVSWEDLGRDLGSLGSFLGSHWKHFWQIFCQLEQYAKIAKNLGKPMVFH